MILIYLDRHQLIYLACSAKQSLFFRVGWDIISPLGMLFYSVGFGLIVGKKGIEGFERCGEAPGSCSWPAGEEAGCGDTEVHAGTCSGSGPSQGSAGEDVHRGAGCAEATDWSL